MDPRFKRTEGYKRLANYFADVIKKDSFQKMVGRMRFKYAIPEKGFNLKENYGAVFCYPTNWKFIDDREKNEEFDKDAQAICDKFHLYDWGAVIDEYVFFNEIIGLEAYVGNYEMCILENEHYNQLKPEVKLNVDKMFPVVIRINPYASKRVIIDYIEQEYKHGIKPLQDKHKQIGARLGKSKKKNKLVEERNDFIYKHRHLPTKEIQSLVSAKFGFSGVIDQGYIGKIISLEKKKRKEV